MSLAGFRVDCSVLVGARGVTFLINGISLSTRLSRQVARACTRAGVASVQELWRRPRREGTGAAVAAMCMARCLGGAQRLSSVRSVNDTLSQPCVFQRNWRLAFPELPRGRCQRSRALATHAQNRRCASPLAPFFTAFGQCLASLAN